MTDFVPAAPELHHLLQLSDAARITRYQGAPEWAAEVQKHFGVSVEGYLEMHINDFARAFMEALDSRADVEGDAK